ncbi:hypothetical protein RN001_016126 [Aquatica leii]|uniref:Uncharacterized protein n=1 Tax=Aquatica leii TaxID=1421715 RepID=A0AAN7PNU4_9COLE|nr:hypothetical protein RN001_016126 [Aquatica leii]
MTDKKKREWQWYEEIRNYDINPIFINDNFEIVFMIELNSESRSVTRQFNACTDQTGTIKSISYAWFLTTIKSYAVTQPPSKLPHVVLFKMLCEKTVPYLSKNLIPTDQMACLLKLLIAVLADNGTGPSSASVELSKKHLFFVLNGFYDINLIKEMWKIDVPPTAILEISGNLIDKDISKVGLVNAVRVSDKDFDVNLKKLWNEVYKYLETNSDIEYLQNCVHMKAHLDNSLEKNFIHQQILKIPDIKQLYYNYKKRLVVFDSFCKPKCLTMKSFKIYNSIMDSTPPDCFTVGFLLHALLEQVCCMIPFKTYKGKKIRKHSSWAKSVINAVLRYYKVTVLTHNVSKSLVNLKVNKQGFVTDAANIFEYKANCYPTLSKKLIKINNDMLFRNRVSVLWKNFYSTNLNSLLQVQLLEKVRKVLGEPPEQKLFYDIHKWFFQNIFSSKEVFVDEVESDLRSICCGKDKHITKIQIYEDLYVCPTNLNLNSSSAVADGLNMHFYMWYEEFFTEVMVQELHQAITDYLCTEFKYNLLYDTILVRFHNYGDEFGIKTFNWNEFIRTPVCLRDFCKYLIDHDDVNDDEYDSSQSDFIKNSHPARPRRFCAYNMGTIVHLEAATTTFTSLDGYKITVDNNYFLETSSISINVSIKDNSLIFHCPKTNNPKLPVGFHYALHDGTIIAFSKSCFKPQLHFGEIIKLKKHKPKRCRNNYHCTVETGRQNSTLVQTEIVPEIMDTKNELNYFDLDVSECKKLINSNLFPSSSEKTFPCVNKVTKHEKASSPAVKVLFSNIHKFVKPKKIDVDNCKKDDLVLNTITFDKIKTILRKIQYAKTFQLPWFKVCSSPLHKRFYIKRVKSYICVELKKHYVNLLCRHPSYKCVEVKNTVKLFPEHFRSKRHRPVMFDMKITVPTGLAIYSVPGTTDMVNIKQRYVNKGPQCKHLKNEYSRTLMTNGYVSVRKTNGTVDVYTSSGEIYTFGVPYGFEKTVTKLKLIKKKTLQHTLTKLEKKIWNATHRRSYHFIGVIRHCLRKKQRPKVGVQYKYVSSCGLQLESFGSDTPKQTQMFYTQTTDLHLQQHMLIRNDGTKLFLDGNGILIAEYKDLTRITSWGEVFFEKPYGLEDWIIVYLVVQFEHPNYATVTHHTYYESTKVILANNVEIDIESNGCYNINVDKMFSSCVNDNEICMQTVLCKNCNESNSTTINLGPLLLSEPNNEILLESFDTYNKCFIVKYNGECQRNSNFIDNLYNRKGCRNHNLEQQQKLFILNRNMSGVRLIEATEFYNRLTDVLVSRTSAIHHCYDENHLCSEYHCFGLSKVTDKSYHSQFIYFPKTLPLASTTKQNLQVYTTISYIHCIPLDKAIQPVLEDTLMNIYAILLSKADDILLEVIDWNNFKESGKYEFYISESVFSNISDESQRDSILPICDSLLIDKINKIFPNLLGKSFSPRSKHGRMLSRILSYLMLDDQYIHEERSLQIMEMNNSVPRRSRKSIFDTLLKDFQAYNYKQELAPVDVTLQYFGVPTEYNLNEYVSQDTSDLENRSLNKEADNLPVNATLCKQPSVIKKIRKRNSSYPKPTIRLSNSDSSKTESKKSYLDKNQQSHNICLLFLSVCLCQNVTKEQLHYLNNLQEDTSSKLKDLIEDKQIVTDFEFHTLPKEQYFTLSDNSSKSVSVSVFDSDCIILESQVYNVTFKNNSFVVEKSFASWSNLLKEANLFRLTEYNGSRLLLVSVTGHSNVYINDNVTDKWLLIQTIATEDKVPDVRFFTNRNQLYLIILNSVDHLPKYSRVYKWTKTHFDEIHKFVTKNAVSVLSFQNKRSEIVLILEKHQNESNVCIFEFSKDQLIKTQLIRNNFVNIVTYTYKDKQYLATLEEAQDSDLYLWNGIEFAHVGKFNGFIKIKKMFLVYTNDIPVFFVFDQNELLAFYHFTNNWRFINQLNFSNDIDEVLGISTVLNDETNAFLIGFKSRYEGVGYLVVPFTMRVNQIGEYSRLNEVIACMLNLETLVKNHTVDDHHKKNFNKTVILVNEEQKYNDTLLTSAAHSSNTHTVTTFPTSHTNVSFIQYVNTKYILLLMGKLIVKGNLSVNRLNVKDLTVNNVNDIQWNSTAWLSYTKPQMITGAVILKNLIAENLTVPKDAKLFHDQNITSKYYLKSLKANNIYIQKINDIEFKDVYLRTSPSTIRGTKHFDVLNVNETTVKYLNKGNASEPIVQLSNTQSKNYVFSLNAYVKNLNFDEINGIVWNDFKNSVFRLGRSNNITGKLLIHSMKCNKLRTKKLGGINPSSLLTTTTNQNIKSAIHWTDVLSQNVRCAKINNISFSDIAFANTIIKSPVSIDKMHIKGNLYINYPENSQNDLDHIIGSDVSDLFQKYNKRVKIIGNLYVENMSVFKGTRVLVNGQDFSDDVVNTFWSKTKFQSVPFFLAQNGITTSHLSTVMLNDNHVSKYLTNDLEDKLPINWVFKNAVILGNVEIKPSMKHKPDLQEIDLVSVKRSGRFNISNKIIVQGNVRVKNLVTNYLDDVKMVDVMNLDTNTKLLDGKIFENLVVKGDVSCNTLITESINNIQLQDLENSVLYTDKNEYINNLWCDNVTVQNANVSYVNKNNVDDYVQYLEQLCRLTTLNNVKVNGKANIRNAEDVVYVNGYKIKKLALKNLDEHIFQQNVKILGTVYAEHVQVVYINNVNFSQLFERVLFRDWDQNITAIYTFGQVNTPNIFVPKINSVFVQDLIDTKSTEMQSLVVPGTLQLNYPTFMKSLNSDKTPCNIERAVNVLQNPPSTYWNTVEVSYNVTLWDNNCHLNVIMDEAVTTKKNNVFYSQVTFEHHVSASNVVLKKFINGVHLNNVFEDAVLKDVPEQIITGHKIFHKLAIANGVAETVYIPIINEIDINLLNASIIDSGNIYNTVIKGPKLFFGGLQANRLITSSISRLNPKSLVTLNDLTVIPTAYFYHLYIDNNFDVAFVNNFNFSNFMAQRLLCNSDYVQFATGVYFVNSAVLLGYTKIPLINDVIVDDIVVDDEVQIIMAPKYFSNNISISNDLLIELLNGQDLVLLYGHSLLLGRDNVIEGSIKFNNVSMFADVQTDRLNGLVITDIEEYIRSASPIVQNDVIRNTIEIMDNEIKSSVKLSNEMSDYYLYLEKANELEIITTNISHAYAYNSKGTVLLYLTQHQKENACSLSNSCPCPIQEVLQITNEKSIHSIGKSHIQRVFGYESDDISIQLVTNGISTSELCRTNSSTGFNETTSLMWITHSPNGAVDHYYYPENVSGYVSGVEFFSYNGSSYVIITRFYEPINNTYNVPCLVFKITKERGDVELIQTISAESAWVLHLFHTVNGVVIIIGSLASTSKLNSNSGVSVYRFDEKLEQFTLLRKTPSNGCTSAVGVVIGPDSLLVVGYKDGPLQVFKYHPKFDNYYFSKNIFTETSVTSLSVFYGSYIGTSDPYLCVVTEGGGFNMYSYSRNEDDAPDCQSVHDSSSKEELSSNEDVNVTAQSKPHNSSSDDDEEPPITKRKKKAQKAITARTSLNGRQMLQIKMFVQDATILLLIFRR